jgi:HAD superfamily hydrolase (TIGR01459 family)
MRRIQGLADIAAEYDGLLCDVWGVLHNGVSAFPDAVDALQKFRRRGGRVVLVTNAPRPSPPIRLQLRSFGVPDDAYDALVTSGDVTRTVIAARPGVKLLHVGHERDLSFYEGLDAKLVPEAEAELISCTGLFDDNVEAPEDYRELFARLVNRRLPMVCANPDIVVERGERLIYCGGALARLYSEMGGEAILVGKPHAPIYAAAKKRFSEFGARRILAAGDGLPTDIRGAVENGVPVLFVTGGIHAADFGPQHEPDGERVAARLHAEGLSAVAYIPRFKWNAGAA